MKNCQNLTTLPAVHGTAKLLQAVGLVNADTGEIAINGKAYFVRVADGVYQLFGWDVSRQEVTRYDVTFDCCNCPDFVARSGQRADGRCKHCKSITALVNVGKLPRIECRRAVRTTRRWHPSF